MTGCPAQRSNGPLETIHLVHLTVLNDTYLVPVDGCSKLLECEGAPNRDGLSRISCPQETIRIPAQRYNYYDLHQVNVSEDRRLNVRLVSMRSIS